MVRAHVDGNTFQLEGRESIFGMFVSSHWMAAGPARERSIRGSARGVKKCRTVRCLAARGDQARAARDESSRRVQEVRSYFPGRPQPVGFRVRLAGLCDGQIIAAVHDRRRFPKGKRPVALIGRREGWKRERVAGDRRKAVVARGSPPRFLSLWVTFDNSSIQGHFRRFSDFFPQSPNNSALRSFDSPGRRI